MVNTPLNYQSVNELREIMIEYIIKISVYTINTRGLQYQPRRSSHMETASSSSHYKCRLCNDIALLSQALLAALESHANGLNMNETITEYIPINIQEDMWVLNLFQKKF